MLKHTRWKLFALLFIIVFCVAIAILFWINTPHNATPNKYIALTQAYLNLRNANMSESKGIDSPTALNQNTTQADTRNFEQNPDQKEKNSSSHQEEGRGAFCLLLRMQR